MLARTKQIKSKPKKRHIIIAFSKTSQLGRLDTSRKEQIKSKPKKTHNYSIFQKLATRETRSISQRLHLCEFNTIPCEGHLNMLTTMHAKAIQLFCVVGRTYGYLLGVASGIPIVNISYLESSVDKMPNGKHQVIGDVDSSEWMAPQRAMSSRRSGGGTTLLDGYTILLYGDFDPEPKTSKRSRSGAAKDVPKTHSTYSAGRFERLLRTCGATVLRDKESFKRIVAATPNDKVAVMLRANPHPRDWRAATKDLDDYPTLPVICGNWLLDSIGNFYVKEFSDYTHASCKK